MAKKTAKKASKKTARKPIRKLRPIKRTQTKKLAGTQAVVKPPMVDVTPHLKDKIVVVSNPAKQGAEQKQKLSEKESDRLHKEFTKALTQEPEKKSLLRRIFKK